MGRHYKKSLRIQTHKFSSVHCGLTHTEGFCLKNYQNICSVMTSSYNTELKQKENNCPGSQHVFLLQTTVGKTSKKLEEDLIAMKVYTFALC